jgi:hypothetical protein
VSLLYPRLLPGAAAARFRKLQESGPQPPRDGEVPSLAEAVFAATGGTRVTAAGLQNIRGEIIERGRTHGFPDLRSRATDASFDAVVARYLHGALDLGPGEASQRQVWSYLGLVLVPDVCAWRYPPREGRGYLDDRVIGADLTRHTLARLWLRAHLLYEADSPDPYSLLQVLGENDIDQLLTRRQDIAATPALVRAVVRAHRDDPRKVGGQLDRDILRDSLKRLMRLAAFVNLDSIGDLGVTALVADARDRSRQVLSSDTLSAGDMREAHQP